ncbi:MAG: hypothetical protein FJ267_20045, partial [Planctomycetes bacterium]|nr:hypothetical protein [Planctomycetota bacterium]
VRRKFLKTNSTEFGHISEQFARVALANPRLHMVLRHNDKSVYELPPSEKPLDRLTLFFGSDVTGELIAVESEHNGVRMWGYVGHPNNSKSTRKHQYLFLNGRWIQDRSLQYALTEAYRGLLMVGRQPVAFVFIEIPPERVDVNVHPSKIEVRFQDGQQLFRQLLSMIRSKFLSLDLQSQLRIPTAATQTGAQGSLSGFSATSQFGQNQIGQNQTNKEIQRELTNEFSDFMASNLGVGSSFETDFPSQVTAPHLGTMAQQNATSQRQPDSLHSTSHTPAPQWHQPHFERAVEPSPVSIGANVGLPANRLASSNPVISVENRLNNDIGQSHSDQAMMEEASQGL